MNPKICTKSRKHKYNSRAAALRAGMQRYGAPGNTYKCPHCGRWHLTRQGLPERDELLERLTDALLGRRTA